MGFGLDFLFGAGSRKGKASEAAQRRLREAIAKNVCVTASYNKGPIHLYQPYKLYQQGGTTLLLAVKVDGPVGHSNVERLETLDVAKLEFLEVTDQAFTPDPKFNPDDPGYGGNVVAAE